MDNVGVCNEVNQANYKAFKQNNIEIPFLQPVQYSMVWPPEAAADDCALHPLEPPRLHATPDSAKLTG